MEKQRILYLDVLRVAAIFIVVMLHVASYSYTGDISSNVWQNSLFWDSLSRWGVPVFVMISGALFLQPTKIVSIRSVYTKYIKRILILLISWSFIYSAHKIITGQIGFGLTKFLTGAIVGAYHLWFLYMIIGLYAITPFLKKMLDNKVYVRYFIALSLFFSFLIPTMSHLADSLNLLGNDRFKIYLDMISDRLHFDFTLEYVAYYVLGYYLSTINLSRRYRYCIYFMGLIGFAFTFGYSSYISIKLNKPWDMFDYMSFNVFFESISMFILIQNLFNKKNKFSDMMSKLSKYTLGIYLIHPIILDIVFEWSEIMVHKYYLAVPLLAICIFCMSFISVWILSKIPIVRKIIY